MGETASALARGRLHTPRPVATSALARPVRRGSPAAPGKRSVFGLQFSRGVC
ncbi:hypothetical protein [Oceanobacillus sp. FSL H7-0719]|uniref:hypothetical protein n=1 Tax=Oceanobacillus sp. FSL H7-0719 TaxID=2954507 RepID=UPI00324AE5DE